MSKWICERAWTISMYLCYVFGYFVVSVALYNYTMSFVGITNMPMKVAIFVCLLVAIIGCLVFSLFVAPFSELIHRFLLWNIKKKKNIRSGESNGVDCEQDFSEIKETMVCPDSDQYNSIPLNSEFELSDYCGNAITHEEAKLNYPSFNNDDNSIKRQKFREDYVSENFKDKPIFDVLCQVLDRYQEGAKTLLAFYCAKRQGWILCIPTYKDARDIFGDKVHSKASNYSTQYKKCTNDDFTSNEITTMENLLKDKLSSLQKVESSPS